MSPEQPTPEQPTPPPIDNTEAERLAIAQRKRWGELKRKKLPSLKDTPFPDERPSAMNEIYTRFDNHDSKDYGDFDDTDISTNPDFIEDQRVNS